jgi:hypothetical protein
VRYSAKQSFTALFHFPFNLRHHSAGSHIQRLCDLEKSFHSRSALTSLDGTQVGPANAGQAADQLLRTFPPFSYPLYDTAHNFSIQHKKSPLYF